MAPKDVTDTEVKADVEAGAEPEAGADTDQVEIGWVEDLMGDFKPIPVGETDNGKSDLPDDDAVDEPDKVDEPDDKPDDAPVESDLIGEADYARNVAIKEKDGTVVHKTVRQLIDEGMYKADYTKKTQELSRKSKKNENDEALLNLIDADKHTRDYLEKRIKDLKSGKAVDTVDDIEIPEDVLEQLPWLKTVKKKLMEHDIEISKSRTNTERTQADQAVGKINSVMETARVAVEKSTGLKLEPDVFRARVGKNIIESLDDNVPEDRKISVAGQMILTDRNYFLSKAKESYQQEIELAKEKAIDSAQQKRAKEGQKTKPLKGGGTTAPSGDLADFKMVKDKHGRPDMDAFLTNAFTKGGKAR